MKNFRIGQEVVYREVYHNPDYASDFIKPKDNETVTIDRYCGSFGGHPHWFVREYLTDRHGRKQVFYEANLHELISTSILIKELQSIPEIV